MRLLDQITFRPDRTQIVRFGISLLLAALLWGWVTQLQDPYVTEKRRFEELEIQAGTLPTSLQLVSELPTGNVTLEGSQSLIDGIARSAVSLSIDTSVVTGPGSFSVPVVVNSPNVSEKSVEPDVVDIQVDQRVTRVFPLTLQNVSEPDGSRRVDDVVPEVSQVTVSGPSSAIDRVEEIVLPITVGDQVSDFDALFSPYAADATNQQISEIEILPSQIQTRVSVQTRGKSVSVIPNVVGEPAEGWTITERRADPDTIVVDGPPEALENLLFVNTDPIDVTGATDSLEGQFGITDLPSGVTVIDPAEGMVTARVALEDSSVSSQTLAAMPVEAIGVGEGLIASIDPETISIEVTAPIEILQSMTAADVSVTVDLSGMQAGTHVLSPTVTVPPGASWLGNEPDTVQVTIVAAPDPAGTPAAMPPSGSSLASGLARPASGLALHASASDTTVGIPGRGDALGKPMESKC